MLLPDLSALARWIGRSDPADTMEQAAILPRLQEMKDAVARRHASSGPREYLEAATALTESICEEGGANRPDEVRDIVLRLLSMTEKALREDEAAGAASAAEAPEVPLTRDMVLGEVLVQMGVVDRGDLGRAVQLHVTEGICIGEALIRTGAATQEDIDLGVRMRKELEVSEAEAQTEEPAAALPDVADPSSDTESNPSDEKAELSLSLGVADPTPLTRVNTAGDRLLGEVLVQLGIVEEGDVSRALGIQRATGMRIGEALVEMGVTDWEGIKKAVEVQGRMRHASGFGPTH